MNWSAAHTSFTNYLRLEKSLAPNTIEAYERDIDKLAKYFAPLEKKPTDLGTTELRSFLQDISELGIAASTLSRMVSGIRGFYSFLELEGIQKSNPAQLLETPKQGLRLPITLSQSEIDSLIASVDLSKPSGTRDKAILETLYSCGLRVSELTGLLISHIYEDDGFVRVIGKGNKERLIPIGGSALKFIAIYRSSVRRHQTIHPGDEDVLFLNHRGKALSRVSIFKLVKQVAEIAGVSKNVSPHTFRHSFASHMVDAGADLRAVQEMLGHESITTTEIYTHLSQDYLREELMTFHPRYVKK